MVAAVSYKIQYHADTSNRTVLTLFGRDTERKRVVLSVCGVEPYFYVPAECRALAESLPEVVKVEPGPPDIEKKPTIRLCTRFPFQVPALRNRFPKTFEADIPFVNRVRMDHGLSYISFAPGSNTLHINDITPLEEPPKVEPRILYIDIETDDTEEGEIEEAKNPVTAISMYDTYTGKYGVIYVGDETIANEKAILEQLPMAFTKTVSLYPIADERELIGTFGALLAQIDPDVVDAFNGYNFDFVYLANRAKRLMWAGPDEDLELVYNSFDEDEQRSKGRFALADSMMIYVKQTMKQRDLSLEAVATELLGVGKVKHVGSVAHLQRTDPVKWLAYSLFDTHLLHAISEKRDMINFLSRVAFIAGIELQDCEYNSRIIDGLLFQEERNNPNRRPEMVLPTKPKEGIEENARAALVFDPVVDLHEWVAVVDNAQTYPSIERTFNISPETYVPVSSPEKTFDIGDYGHFVREPPGLIPRAIRRLMEHRQKAKDKATRAVPGIDKREAETLSQALKYIINAGTGVMMEAHWRMRRREAFESVTAIARAQLLWNRNHIENPEWMSSILGVGHSARVVAGHTDSNWFKIYKDGVQLKAYDAVVPVAEKIRNALNESYNEFAAQYGATQHWLSCDLEGVLNVFRTLPKADSDSEGAKTRYFGTFVYKDGKDMRPYPFDARKKIMGVEIRRFNNSPLSKEAQERVIEMVCTGQDVEVRAYVDKLKEGVLRGERDEDLLIPVKRNTTEANQPQIRAVNAAISVLGLKVRRGDVLRWFYVRSLRVKGVLHEARELAIPSHLTLEDMRAQGVDIRLDREAMWAKVERAVELVYPDLKRKEEMLAEAF